ncbi:hypothetical protein [Candidatus Burkholderia verschuerenii]|uniref:hypothetical protein n=1 Tax=Candidatus Burkholderia verschuerenii TaxID=242163 RepID=UPI000AB4B887|nr:hypothetical protein [Candidatus Burkholderia verschuerenii]
MEDFDETLFLVWRANLKVLTGSPGGAGRLARMMNFSPSFMKLIVAGQRDFNEEFVRGIELVTGLPPHWMDDRRAAEEVPADVQRALDEETPVAVFRGTAHPQPKRSILRGPEPLLSQTEATRRVADIAQQQAEANRRDLIFRKNRELLSQDLRRLERQLSLLQVDTMQPKVDELLASDRMSEAAKADLSGRLEQVDKHVKLLHQHVEKLVTLLSARTMSTAASDAQRYFLMPRCSSSVSGSGCTAIGSLAGKVSSSASSSSASASAGFGSFAWSCGRAFVMMRSTMQVPRSSQYNSVDRRPLPARAGRQRARR